jgi:hypothetical protein
MLQQVLWSEDDVLSAFSLHSFTTQACRDMGSLHLPG